MSHDYFLFIFNLKIQIDFFEPTERAGIAGGHDSMGHSRPLNRAISTFISLR